ncbi:hypothetical protein F5882DRAFT_361735 [Hyaloscypha sp. PMI_1271]|nr:hypothetical protein F5882DRAFT_361735 [Hyaloscypha sp. PMI_1271]
MELPKYRVNGFTISCEGETSEFVLLHVCLHAKRLHIHISPSNFRNSSSTVKEFYKYFQVALTGLDAFDNDLIHDFFDWSVRPFLSVFQNQAPGPRDISKGTVTLQDLLYAESYDCELGAIDDNTVAGQIERREVEEAYIPSDIIDDLVQLTKAPDTQPDRVRVEVDNQILFFKSAEHVGYERALKEARKFLTIAHLGEDLRTSRLYGIVQDENNPLIGLLFHYIDGENSLEFAVGPDTPASLKDQWTSQVTDTLTTLHKAGVVWGDAKADNVLIDTQNNAWIIDFEGGYTEGWVGHDKEGTIEGDLQGLANIIDFIYNPEAWRDGLTDDDSFE